SFRRAPLRRPGPLEERDVVLEERGHDAAAAHQLVLEHRQDGEPAAEGQARAEEHPEDPGEAHPSGQRAGRSRDGLCWPMAGGARWMRGRRPSKDSGSATSAKSSPGMGWIMSSAAVWA